MKTNADRASCKDVFNAFLVALARYAGLFDFPVIQPEREKGRQMGGGLHGGFGPTSGAVKSGLFTPVQFEGTVKVAGEERDVSRRVYQRNDIDFHYYDTKNEETNLEKMLDGRAPFDSNGRPVQLHHILQQEVGPMVEIREMTHQEYKRILHGLGGNGMSFRNDPILDKQYSNFRAAYWKWRARQYLASKGER